MNNPLPVEKFSVAEAARRTWPLLIEAMLDAVCLVEPQGLRIVAANSAAGRLFGVAPAELVGRDMLAAAATPEDEIYWAETTAAHGPAAGIVSESFVRGAGGEAVPVLRRVSRVVPGPGNALYVVVLHDRSEQVDKDRGAEVTAAEFAATLESVADGVLVTDLAGHISHFNRRFAALWELPEEMLLLRADDEIFAWMHECVADPARYARRLGEIENAPEAPALDRLALRRGAVLERSSVPQRSRGRTIGRVFSYRRIEPGLS